MEKFSNDPVGESLEQNLETSEISTETAEREITSSVSPAQLPKKSLPRKFFSAASAMILGMSPVAPMAEATPVSPKPAQPAQEKQEQHITPPHEKALLDKIHLKKEQIKPELLKKYMEGAYKAIVIIDLKQQVLNVYDKDGKQIIANAGVSTGRPGKDTITPVESIESGKRELVHQNKEGAYMPYCVPIGEMDTTGMGIHVGSLAGTAARSSHGCVRTREETAKLIYELADKPHGLVIVIREE